MSDERLRDLERRVERDPTDHAARAALLVERGRLEDRPCGTCDGRVWNPKPAPKGLGSIVRSPVRAVPAAGIAQGSLVGLNGDGEVVPLADSGSVIGRVTHVHSESLVDVALEQRPPIRGTPVFYSRPTRARCWACGGLGSAWRYRLTIAAWFGEPGAQGALGRVSFLAARRFHPEVWARASAAVVAARLESRVREASATHLQEEAVRVAWNAGLLTGQDAARALENAAASWAEIQQEILEATRLHGGAVDAFALNPMVLTHHGHWPTPVVVSTVVHHFAGGLVARFHDVARFLAELPQVPLRARRREGAHSVPTYLAQEISHALALMDDPDMARAMCREVGAWALNGEDAPRDRLRVSDPEGLALINRMRARSAGLVLNAAAPLLREPRHVIKPSVT